VGTLSSLQHLTSSSPWSFINQHQHIFEMTDKLPPNLLALCAPRPPLRWVPPADHAPAERRTAAISGLAAFLPALEEYKEKDVYEPTESWLQRKDRIRLEKKERQERLTQGTSILCEGDPICLIAFLLLSVRILGQVSGSTFY